MTALPLVVDDPDLELYRVPDARPGPEPSPGRVTAVLVVHAGWLAIVAGAGDKVVRKRGAERLHGKIPGSVLIPKDRILGGAALADLPQDRQLVLYCKSGVRSAEALALLKQSGFSTARHLGGGITAWAKTVDPSVPVY